MFYVAEVRDNRDPSGTGRIKVRFYNKENNEKEIPDAGLKWAHPMLPITSMTSGGVGHKPPAPPIGARVICIYLDDDYEQRSPYYIGCVIRSERADSSGIQQTDTKTGTKAPNKTAVAEADVPGGKIV